MNKEQEQKLKDATNYTLKEIKEMDNLEFYKKITKAFVDRKLTPEQYRWLENQRHGEIEQTIMKFFKVESIESEPIGNCLKD